MCLIQSVLIHSLQGQLPSVKRAARRSWLLHVPLLALVSLDGFGQSFSTRAIGPTNGINSTITGLNNHDVVVGTRDEPIIIGSSQVDRSWLWQPAEGAGLPQGYTIIGPPSGGIVGDRTLSFIGNDDDGNVIANLYGDVTTTDAQLAVIPPTAWRGSIARWRDGTLTLLQVPWPRPRDATGRSGPAVSLPGLPGEYYVFSYGANSIGASGIVQGQIRYAEFIRAEFGTNGWAETTGPQITAPIIYDTKLSSWSFLETGGSNTTRIISAPNKFGDMVGWELIDQVAGQSPLFQPRKWTRPGTMQNYSPVGLPPNAVPMVINDAGEVAGAFGTNITVTAYSASVTSTNATAGIFIYLPSPNYGFGAGTRIITNGLDFVQCLGLNNRGQLLMTYVKGVTNSTSALWSQGTFSPLAELLSGSGAWTNAFGAAINDKGTVVGYGTSVGGESMFMARPWIDIEVVANTNRVHIGEDIEIKVNVGNYHLDSPITGLVMREDPTLSPSRIATTSSGPVPAGPLTLASGASTNFTYHLTATNAGTLHVSAQVRGTNNNTRYTSFRATSEAIRVVDWGDLLVKRDSDPANKYLGDDIYDEQPQPGQTLTNLIRLSSEAVFQVKIQNEDNLPRQFILTAVDWANKGWTTKYLYDGTDVSTAVRSGNGYTLPELAANASQLVTVQMTTTNQFSGDDERAELRLYSTRDPATVIDAVELATFAMREIIVNTTGDEADADPNDLFPDVDLTKPGLQTTLRSAIDFANRRAVPDLIRFEIPATDPNYRGGIPRIRPATALPAITDSLVIDGGSQNPNSLTPPVEISGENANLTGEIRPAGLEIFNVQNCEIRGLAIFGFAVAGVNSTDLGAKRADGILLNSASNCRVEGCHLGMDGPGLTAKGNDGYGIAAILGSDLNVIGGDTQQQGNLITGNGLGGVAVLGSKFNFVLHNRIGLNAAGLPVGNGSMRLLDQLPIEGFGDFPDFVTLAGIVVHDSDRTQVEDNRIAAQRGFGILIINSSGERNEARRNSIGKANVSDSASFGCWHNGIRLVGDATIAADNHIIGNKAHGIFAHAGENHLIQENFIAQNEGDGISLASITNSTVIGNRIDGNGQNGINLILADNIRMGLGEYNEPQPNIIINHPEAGIKVDASFHLLIAGNFIGVEDDGLTIKPNQTGVVVRSGRDNEIGNDDLIPGSGRENSISAQDEKILIADERNRISMNRFVEDTLHPIDLADFGSLQGDGQDQKDSGDTDQGGNTKLNTPGVLSVVLDAQGTATIQIKLFNVTVGEHRIAIYQERKENTTNTLWPITILEPVGTFQQTLLLQPTVSLTLFGGGIKPAEFVQATLTDSSGNTSEMSDSQLVQTSTDTDLDAMSNGVESLTPPRSGAFPQNAGDGNGDGTGDTQQANVTSLPGLSGKWITLATPGVVALSNVQVFSSQAFASLPPGYAFPFGFLAVTLSGMNSGATVTLTNILHDSALPTTVFAYGPTLGNLQPHWYELSASFAGDELRLTLTDGAIGDLDLVANGNITTTYALAYLIPPGPTLTLLSSTTSPTQGLDIIEVNGQLTLTTNQAQLRNSVLAWPASATNYVLQTTVGLSPTNLWRSLPTQPGLVGNQLVVTNTSLDPIRFYRLRAGYVTPAPVPAPTLDIQRTATNTFLLSWPSSFPGFGLQQNTNLISATWSTLTNAVNVTNNQNQVVLPPAAGSRYFRLKSQ